MARRSNRQDRTRRRERGQSLIIALILLVIAAVLVVGSIRFYEQGARHGVAHAGIIRERYLAEAGIQLTLHKLNSDDEFSEEIQNLDSGQRNPFDSGTAPGSINWGGGTITVVIEPYE